VRFAGDPVDSVWGVPVIQTPAIGQDQAVVADWARAATLYVREGLVTRVSDSDQDDLLRNRLTILVETRVGLMVAQPSLVCVVNLGAGVSPAAGAKGATPAKSKS
jgi:HK97 family phage major capsid protein